MAETGIPILGPILNRIIGTRNDRFVKRYTQRVNAINALEPQYQKLTDKELSGKLLEFRARVDKGESPDVVMIDAFATAREAMDRAVGIRNVFNPERNFDPSLLAPAARDLYAKLRAEADAREPAAPTGEWAGNTEPIPGWRQITIPPEFYMAVREIFKESRPPYRARPFDVQLIGGMVLCQGKISEMRTGEGKTIVGPLACYMAAIERMKVHVVTVNDYLVQRDRDWTFPYFHALGLTVGAIHPQHMQDEGMKRVMYRCDVVYGTTSEFGFDYLRDNMKRSVDQQVQRRRQFAIVDEVDSILIDEARTPLIISGQAHDDAPRYDLADRLARHLVDKQRPWEEHNEKVLRCQMRIKGLEGEIRQVRDRARVPELQKQMAAAKAELPGLERERDKFVQYYETKIERKQTHATHHGIAEAQRAAGIGSFYVDQNMDLPHLLEQSLRAHTCYERDKDYVIMPAQDPNTGRTVPSVVIVDANTGRPMIGRQWSDGLHQAIECKEKVQIKQETQTVATVTIQNFFKMYKRLAGMTGTADTEAQEFNDIYKLDVVSIPTNKPVVRRDFDDMVFLSAKDKWNAITDEIKNFHDCGRPVLVGTTSVEKSESLSKMLTSKHAVQHEVLNAKQHEREAHIVENAGQLGAVMIATNMAGRGTDIKLGAVTREKLLDHWLRRGICPRTVTVESTEEQLREGVYRKIASKELDLQKRDAETIPFAELEIQLLRHWAARFTWLPEKKIGSLGAEDLRKELDQTGRFLLHRLRWFETIEEMGGLHVIGTERHDARRIDNQLRGRSGRQGDRGSSRFFISLEDDLMKRFAGETQMKVLARLGMKEGDAIEHPWLSKSVERAQRKVEEYFFQIRKNVLEYDEVMEHQRQAFYGTRQRVLEGRSVKVLLLDYIRSTVQAATDEYLDPDYPAVCAAEYAKGKLDCSVAPDRLRGRELHEMELTIIEEALYEARQNIGMTVGEYMPTAGSDVEMDFDAAGLCNWARTRFGLEIDPSSLRESAKDRQKIEDTLYAAAEAQIKSVDLSGLAEFVQPNFAENQMSRWAKDKLDMDVAVQDVVKASKGEEGPAGVTTMLMRRVNEIFERREIEYPIEYAMQIAQMTMRQNPTDAANQLVGWANRRFDLALTPDEVMKRSPQAFRQQMFEHARKFVEGKSIEKAVSAAQACKTDEDLASHIQARFQRELPEHMRFLEGQERQDAIRSFVENQLRAELLQFERSILLETLDSSWKDHLYAMDQLRDTINFRAISQQDPRTEFKREGSHQFASMMEGVRGRVSEYVFRARLMAQPPAARPPQAMGAGPMGAAPMAAATQRSPLPGGLGGAISGPGISGQGISGPGIM